MNLLRFRIGIDLIWCGWIGYPITSLAEAEVKIGKKSTVMGMAAGNK